MKLLLDTHIWLWSLSRPKCLSRRATRALTDPRNELWLSPLSSWEIISLTQKGRLTLDCSAELWIERALRERAFREAPLTHQVSLATAQVGLPHRDPIDRFLAASARVYELTLMTVDANLHEGTGFSIFQD